MPKPKNQLMLNMKKQINYPRFLIQSNPTPSNNLYICERCGNARWSVFLTGSRLPNCSTGHNPSRMRHATKEESEQGKKHLK